MADPATPSEEARPRHWKRYALIAAPIVLAAVVLGFFFFDRVMISGYINKLNASDARVRKEQIDALKAHEDKELVNELLNGAVRDDDRTFEVRMICANLLLERQRLPLLEAAFESGSLETRGLVAKVFARERWFDKFVEDQGGRVQQVVRDWLEQGSNLTKSHAIQLAMRLDMPELMPAIRRILTEPQPANVHPEVRRDLLISAAGAAERLKDCGSIPRVAELARTHDHPLVRLRCMQIADRAVFRATPTPICPGAVPEEQMAELVRTALADGDHRVRLGSMLILARQPTWAAPVLDRLQSLLDGGGAPAERRQALETLAAVGGPAFIERFPRYFHDPMMEVRSSCARVAPTLEGAPMAGCLAGILTDEVESESLWMNAVDALRRTAKAWHGLGERQQLRATREPAKWRKELQTLFSRGEIEDLTREAFATAWFRWWCGELQLTPEQTEKAVAARASFYEAKGRADATAAEAALDGAGVDVPGLFSYERGWLQARAGS